MAQTIDIAEIAEALKNKLEALLAEKRKIMLRDREIDRLIGGLHQSLSGLLLYADAMDQTDEKLTALVKSIADLLFPSNASGTLTETCRSVLRKAKWRMSATDVKKAVEASGFDFSNYTSNPLSSIHTTLRRLKEGEEAREIVVDGTKYYKWIGKSEEQQPNPFSLSLGGLLNQPNLATYNANSSVTKAIEEFGKSHDLSKVLEEATKTSGRGLSALLGKK